MYFIVKIPIWKEHRKRLKGFFVGQKPQFRATAFCSLDFFLTLMWVSRTISCLYRPCDSYLVRRMFSRSEGCHQKDSTIAKQIWDRLSSYWHPTSYNNKIPHQHGFFVPWKSFLLAHKRPKYSVSENESFVEDHSSKSWSLSSFRNLLFTFTWNDCLLILASQDYSRLNFLVLPFLKSVLLTLMNRINVKESIAMSKGTDKNMPVPGCQISFLDKLLVSEGNRCHIRSFSYVTFMKYSLKRKKSLLFQEMCKLSNPYSDLQVFLFRIWRQRNIHKIPRLHTNMWTNLVSRTILWTSFFRFHRIPYLSWKIQITKAWSSRHLQIQWSFIHERLHLLRLKRDLSWGLIVCFAKVLLLILLCK
jgi:hypothetical protein